MTDHNYAGQIGILTCVVIFWGAIISIQLIRIVDLLTPPELERKGKNEDATNS